MKVIKNKEDRIYGLTPAEKDLLNKGFMGRLLVYKSIMERKNCSLEIAKGSVHYYEN